MTRSSQAGRLFPITCRKGPDDFDLLKRWLVEGLKGKKLHPRLDKSPPPQAFAAPDHHNFFFCRPLTHRLSSPTRKSSRKGDTSAEPERISPKPYFSRLDRIIHHGTRPTEEEAAVRETARAPDRPEEGPQPARQRPHREELVRQTAIPPLLRTGFEDGMRRLPEKGSLS